MSESILLKDLTPKLMKAAEKIESLTHQPIDLHVVNSKRQLEMFEGVPVILAVLTKCVEGNGSDLFDLPIENLNGLEDLTYDEILSVFSTDYIDVLANMLINFGIIIEVTIH